MRHRLVYRPLLLDELLGPITRVTGGPRRAGTGPVCSGLSGVPHERARGVLGSAVVLALPPPLLLPTRLLLLLLDVALADDLRPAVGAGSLVVEPALEALHVKPVAAVEPAQRLPGLVQGGHADGAVSALRLLEARDGADSLGRNRQAAPLHVAPRQPRLKLSARVVEGAVRDVHAIFRLVYHLNDGLVALLSVAVGELGEVYGPPEQRVLPVHEESYGGVDVGSRAVVLPVGAHGGFLFLEGGEFGLLDRSRSLADPAALRLAGEHQRLPHPPPHPLPLENPPVVRRVPEDLAERPAAAAGVVVVHVVLLPSGKRRVEPTERIGFRVTASLLV